MALGLAAFRQNKLELIVNTRGSRICDLACGQGVLAQRLAGQGAHVVGVDLSLELLQIAQREEHADPLGTTYLQDDAQHLHSLADATFDGVVCNLALMDIAHLPNAASTIWRISLCSALYFSHRQSLQKSVRRL